MNRAFKKYLPYILAGLVFLFSLAMLRPAPQEQVVVAAVDLPRGRVLSAGDLTVKSFPKDMLPASADVITDPSQAIGQAVQVDRTTGDVLLLSHLGRESVELKPNERAIAIQVSDSSGMAGLLRAGDRVGVNAVMLQQDLERSGAYSKATIENLRVLYMTPSFTAEKPGDENGAVVTPDPVTGIAVQKDRSKEGTVVLAVPVEAMAVVYDFKTISPDIPGQTRLVNAIELLAALNAAENTALTLYLMPDESEPFASSGIWLPDLMVFAATSTPTPTPTNTPYGVPMPLFTPTPLPQGGEQ